MQFISKDSGFTVDCSRLYFDIDDSWDGSIVNDSIGKEIDGIGNAQGIECSQSIRFQLAWQVSFQWCLS
eukprot:scaffold161999_cov90-Attheya_sp.AAC.5